MELLLFLRFISMCAETCLGKCILLDLSCSSFLLKKSKANSESLNSATSVIVFSMCRLIVSAMREGNKQVIEDAKRIAGEDADSEWIPVTPQELTYRIFCTTYMGSENSSSDTRKRAKDLAQAIGAFHINIDIDTVTAAIAKLFSTWSGWMPRFKSNGGSVAQSVALQNIQARTRMVLAYLLAQLLPSVSTFRGGKGGGSLLVLGSANVDEAVFGYLTKASSVGAAISQTSNADSKILHSMTAAPPT